MKLKKFVKGFSLIELSIVILIASIFASAMIGILGKKTLVDKNAETKERMVRISEALKIYYETNNYLPCPAGLVDAINEKNFGQGGSDGSGSCGQATATDAQDVASGTVPVSELGLAPQYMFDSWGNKIVYIVDKGLATTSFDPNIHVSNIVLHDTGGNNLVTRLPLASEIGQTYTLCDGVSDTIDDYGVRIPDCPAFLLISHGVNGYLAYNSAGTQKLSAVGMGSDHEVHNTPNNEGEAFDNIFVSAPINQDTKMSDMSNYFDDILYYKSMSYFTGETPPAGTP